MTEEMPVRALSRDERKFYRDRLRAARYAALADSEGFDEICFAVESLGMRLLGERATLGEGSPPKYKGYQRCILALANSVSNRENLVARFPNCFSRVGSLYQALRNARNDAMHTGAYARHATTAAIELCIHLEEAVMVAESSKPEEVQDRMVRQAVTIEDWHPVAYARQLMLTHSFSFLPVRIKNEWELVSEISVAKFLRTDRSRRLALPICDAVRQQAPMLLEKPMLIRPDETIDNLYEASFPCNARLWLVTESDNSERLLGVLSPFELM